MHRLVVKEVDGANGMGEKVENSYRNQSPIKPITLMVGTEPFLLAIWHDNGIPPQRWLAKKLFKSRARYFGTGLSVDNMLIVFIHCIFFLGKVVRLQSNIEWVRRLGRVLQWLALTLVDPL
jgi:hypothetical protein